MDTFFAALYAAAEYLRDGLAGEVEVCHDFSRGDCVSTLTVIVRRADQVEAEPEAAE